jgi:hypothetical protein
MAIQPRPTGPGTISTNSVVPDGAVRAVLTNYDIDVDALKPEHLRFLESKVLPLIVGRRARVWLQGSASHTGADAPNMNPSRRRAEKVADYLRGRGIPRNQIQIDVSNALSPIFLVQSFGRASGPDLDHRVGRIEPETFGARSFRGTNETHAGRTPRTHRASTW